MPGKVFPDSCQVVMAALQWVLLQTVQYDPIGVSFSACFCFGAMLMQGSKQQRLSYYRVQR